MIAARPQPSALLGQACGISRWAPVDYSMGTLVEADLDKNWPGPGAALTCDHSERTHRAFHSKWLEMMKAEG